MAELDVLWSWACSCQDGMSFSPGVLGKMESGRAWAGELSSSTVDGPRRGLPVPETMGPTESLSKSHWKPAPISRTARLG